jgi:hypothetical protein
MKITRKFIRPKIPVNFKDTAVIRLAGQPASKKRKNKIPPLRYEPYPNPIEIGDIRGFY